MPICKFDGCTKKANSNFKNEKKKIFCAKHKEKNMIDLDEKTKYCIVIECTTRASFIIMLMKIKPFIVFNIAKKI
jgi:hypothetical protein